MDLLLKMLKENARETDAALAKQLGTTEEDVKARVAAYEREGVIRGFHALINPNRDEGMSVRAVIELRVRPEREGGFDRLATRVSKFPQVEALFLMSGGFDLLLFVKGKNLKEVAEFVSVGLATLDGVISSETHFMLKTYKDQDVLMESEDHDDRLQVCP
ncbi:MAG: Lrp/AsnC family transcriptional regulator [Kiritimatiellaeota bacterium]|nr:Lrp/AsnC family transcriptional regulator [Kiritimatiellota bacterium]